MGRGEGCSSGEASAPGMPCSQPRRAMATARRLRVLGLKPAPVSPAPHPKTSLPAWQRVTWGLDALSPTEAIAPWHPRQLYRRRSNPAWARECLVPASHPSRVPSKTSPAVPTSNWCERLPSSPASPASSLSPSQGRGGGAPHVTVMQVARGRELAWLSGETGLKEQHGLCSSKLPFFFCYFPPKIA